MSWKLAKAVSATSLIDRSYLTVGAMNTRLDDRHVQLDSRFQHNTRCYATESLNAPSCCCRLLRRHEGSWQTPLVFICFLKYMHNKYNNKWHNDAIKYDNECSYREMYKSFLLPVMRRTLLKIVPWNMTALLITSQSIKAEDQIIAARVWKCTFQKLQTLKNSRWPC